MAIKSTVRFDLGRRIVDHHLGEPDAVVEGKRIHYVDDQTMNFGVGLHGPDGAIARLGLEHAGRDPARNRTAFAEKPAAP